MARIHKYQLKQGERTTLEMSADAQILCVQNQDGVPMMWAVEGSQSGAPKATFHIECLGTGWEFSEYPGSYLGTVQVDGFVWHYFSR